MALKRVHSTDIVIDKDSTGNESKKKKMSGRPFDFKLHPKRKIALKFLYFGWDFCGLVQQDHTENTVEKYLMDALVKTKLVEDDKMCDLTRCGRTDKGVSAYTQVVALIVRSCETDDPSVYWPEGTDEAVKADYISKPELNYVKMLNGVLPNNIQVTAWASVPFDFSARHSCNMRTYRYAFPRANLNLQKMREACQLLVGNHDFRNFCQIDMNEARVSMNYIREIFHVQLDEVESTNSPYDLLELTVKGSGFLWHMIRFIVSIIHTVGQGLEEPELVTTLLDVEKYPGRPHYTMAKDTPLCLYDCRFDTLNLKWHMDDYSLTKSITHLQITAADYLTKARLIQNMLDDITSKEEAKDIDTNRGLLEFTMNMPIMPTYVPFDKRTTCDSLENKRAKLARKKKKRMEN